MKNNAFIWLSLLLRISFGSKALIELTAVANISILISDQTFLGPILSKSWNESQTCLLLFKKSEKTSTTWPPPPAINQRFKVCSFLVFGNSLILSHFKQKAYTTGNRVPILGAYFVDMQNGGKGYVWSREYLQTLMESENTCGTYNKTFCKDAVIATKESYIKGKVGMVIGSQSPWAEASLLKAGASHIITIEYMSIKTDYKSLTAYTPSKLARKVMLNKWRPVDFIWSYSSIEHDGLGRYGDPLNPYGDFEAISRIFCLLKPGGILYLGVPLGQDTLVWNAHRIYGKIRLPLLLRNWEVIDIFGDLNFQADLTLFDYDQPVIVLRKPFT